MKHLYRAYYTGAILGLLLTCSTLAQAPREFSYQGEATDNVGNPLPDGVHSFGFRLYNVANGGAPLAGVAQNVPTTNGVFTTSIDLFNTLLAGVDPLSVMNGQYWLGITIDGGAELLPRTPLLAVPYAIHAEVAQTAAELAPNANGVVTQLNGIDGNVHLIGAGGTTVTQNGNSITVSSAGGGGSGIQGVQNIDGSIAIQDPNGPTATVSVAPNGITNGKIANNSVTAPKMRPAVGNNPQVLISENGTVAWQGLPSAEEFTLPYYDSLDITTSIFRILTNGRGTAIHGNSHDKGIAIAGTSTHSGLAGSFLSLSKTDSNEAVVIKTYGKGDGLLGEIDNTSSVKAAIHGVNNSTAGVSVVSSAPGAVGVLGEITSEKAGLKSAGVMGINQGAHFFSFGVYGLHEGSGTGVYGSSPNGSNGVYGTCNSDSGRGVYGFATGDNAYGVFGLANGSNGIGLYGSSPSRNGYAVYSNGQAFKTIGGSSWAIPSDARLKEEVQAFTDGLNVIERINPISYRYNGLAGTRTDRTEYGIMAQEMAEIAPYTVETRTVRLDEERTEEEIFIYNSSPLTYVLINAIKELSGRTSTIENQLSMNVKSENTSEEIELLMSTVERHEQTIEELSERITMLEAIIRER